MKRKPSVIPTQAITAFISTTLVLVLLGAITLFVLTARNLSNYVRENINVSILISDDMEQQEVRAKLASFSNEPYVKDITYISKEAALREEIRAMGTDPSEFLGYNPFTASYEVKVNAEYANTDSMTTIVRSLKSDPAVVDVIYQKDLIDAVNKNIRKASVILLIIAALFSYISFALINNTVRLSLFSHRFIINTQKLVGASWGFIRRPFIYRGLKLGVLSGMVAVALIVFGVRSLWQYEPETMAVIDFRVVGIVSIVTLVAGIVITFVCTVVSLNKYLKMSSKDLYYI